MAWIREDIEQWRAILKFEQLKIDPMARDAFLSAIAEIERLNQPRGQSGKIGKRRITGAFLEQVAEVYRNNIDHAPTEAVSRTFGVKHRMATDYVKQARDRGLLPSTRQGRARA